PLGNTAPPSGLRATENRAFEANIRANHPDFKFYTSEHNNGHEANRCKNGNYTPGDMHSPSGKEIWRQWQVQYTGKARGPCWIVRVPKDIIWGHGGKTLTPKPMKAPRTPVHTAEGGQASSAASD